LLVEDQAVNQRIATAMLEHLGYEVDVAADGQEAVDAALAAPYGAILMDCQLPLLGGYEATEKIRVAEGTTRHTPIVAVTGRACLPNSSVVSPRAWTIAS
jgi:CheY-like chemotaxis protein